MKFFGSQISLGQIVALALTGLAAYHEVDTNPAGAAIFLDPERTAPYLNEVLSILAPRPVQADLPLPPTTFGGPVQSTTAPVQLSGVVPQAQQTDSLGVVRGAGGSV